MLMASMEIFKPAVISQEVRGKIHCCDLTARRKVVASVGTVGDLSVELEVHRRSVTSFKLMAVGPRSEIR